MSTEQMLVKAMHEQPVVVVITLLLVTLIVRGVVRVTNAITLPVLALWTGRRASLTAHRNFVHEPRVGGLSSLST